MTITEDEVLRMTSLWHEITHNRQVRSRETYSGIWII